MESRLSLNRRDFSRSEERPGRRTGLLAGRSLAAVQDAPAAPPARPATNIADALKVPRMKTSLPDYSRTGRRGPEPGLRIRSKVDPAAVKASSTRYHDAHGKDIRSSFGMFFTKDDVVGSRSTPSARSYQHASEVVDAIVEWLEKSGLPRKNMIIWDRFDYMLRTPVHFRAYPGISCEGLQTMDEAAAEGKSKDNSRWLRPDGTHVSTDNFDRDVYYWADVEAPRMRPTSNQHVFNGKYSYFGKLLTQKLTKINQRPGLQEHGSAISMATKNIGYGACAIRTGSTSPLRTTSASRSRLPVVRDKWVLTVTDGIKGQYEGARARGKFIYDLGALYFATDPSPDLVCHNLIVAAQGDGRQGQRASRMTEYLRTARKWDLGSPNPAKIAHVRV